MFNFTEVEVSVPPSLHRSKAILCSKMEQIQCTWNGSVAKFNKTVRTCWWCGICCYSRLAAVTNGLWLLVCCPFVCMWWVWNVVIYFSLYCVTFTFDLISIWKCVFLCYLVCVCDFFLAFCLFFLVHYIWQNIDHFCNTCPSKFNEFEKNPGIKILDLFCSSRQLVSFNNCSQWGNCCSRVSTG